MTSSFLSYILRPPPSPISALFLLLYVIDFLNSLSQFSRQIFGFWSNFYKKMTFWLDWENFQASQNIISLLKVALLTGMKYAKIFLNFEIGDILISQGFKLSKYFKLGIREC